MWLKTELPDLRNRRTQLAAVLDYLGVLGTRLPHWEKDAHAATLLAGALRNENV